MTFHSLLLQARSYTKRPANDFDKAMELCAAFCKLNHIVNPAWWMGGLNKGLYVNCGKHGGPPEIWLEPTKCRWSWWSKPGNKADVTTFGVAAHELGHHWHYHHFKTWQAGVSAWEKGGKHKSITTYAATSTTEQLAEAFRLFVLNPQRLLELSPVSAKFFVAHGLRHPELRRKVRT